MPVRKDASGRRYVQAEIEVPGTPEEVWKAIATGPGISSWFVPTQLETDQGGTPVKVVSHFGPDASMDSVATVTAWEPPRRFVGESPGEGPNAPSVATEWTVEARSGGTCLVRVVHSWFASTDDWDGQFEGHEYGWAAFFRILRLYLASFRGQPCSAFQLMAFAPGPTATAWVTLTDPLGLSTASEGQHVKSPAGAPHLSGVVERVGAPEYPELLLRLDERGLESPICSRCRWVETSVFQSASISMATGPQSSPPARNHGGRRGSRRSFNQPVMQTSGPDRLARYAGGVPKTGRAA
jgi:uncharacterized protein YndB with AHSA1/START domain